MPPRGARKAPSPDRDYEPTAKRIRPRRTPVPEPTPKRTPKRKPKGGEGSDEVNPLQTDSREVTGPVIEAINANLQNAYKIHKAHQMCYIFDFVTPARQWKTGTEYTEDGPDADYGPQPWPHLTEVEDKDGYELKSYYPREVE